MWERDETGHGSLALFFHFSRLFTSYISLRDERREEMEEMGDLRKVSVCPWSSVTRFSIILSTPLPSPFSFSSCPEGLATEGRR